jgi:hypothetical protein
MRYLGWSTIILNLLIFVAIVVGYYVEKANNNSSKLVLFLAGIPLSLSILYILLTLYP